MVGMRPNAESGFRQAQLRSRSSLLIADPVSVTQL
jgi:hypothetical protein